MDIDQILAHHLLDYHIAYLFKVGSIPVYLTIHGVMMLIAIAILCLMLAVARAQAGTVSRGFATLVEMTIVHIRDEVVRPSLGPLTDRYLSYFLTLFFFILTCNLLGMIPYGRTATSNLAVTAVLAVITFLMIILSGLWFQGPIGFLKTFVPPGIPKVMIPFIFAVEIFSLFARNLAMCIRLFANMVGGHISILIVLSMILLFKSVWVIPFSVAGAVALSALELFICCLQAYVFTLLTAIFVGAAVQEHH